MSATEVGRIKIKLVADGDGLAESIDSELGRAEKGAAGKVGMFFTKMAAAGGAALVATAAKSVFDFTSFERSMNEVFTLMPGISGPAMEKMTDQVKDFSKEFGVLPDKVVPALYQSLSAGVPADNVFAFLETAQKAAKGGVTDLTTAVDGISSVVNAYGSDVVSATQASDAMFTAVRLGKTNFSELSASMFNVTPTAAALGVKFTDVSAALAAMTLQGVPTSVATTQLRQLFVELSKAGTDTSKTFEKLAGKNFKEFIAGGGDMQGALKLLEKHAKDSGLGINDLFGSVEAGAAALSLTGQGTGKFTEALKGMQGSAGATEAAFGQMEKGIGPIFDRMKARASVALLDMGTKITGFATNLVAGFKNGERGGHDFATKLGTSLKVLIAGFREGDVTCAGFYGKLERLGIIGRAVFDWIKANATPIAAALGVVLVSVLVPAVTSLAASVIALFSPVVLIIGAIALLVGGVVYAYQHFEGFRNAVDAVASWLIDTAWPKIQQFAAFIGEQFGALVGWVQEHWALISEAIGHVVAAIQTVIETWVSYVKMLWSTFGDEILEVARVIWDQIRNIVETAINIVRGVIEVAIALINGDWGKAWDGIKGIVSTAWEFIRETVVNAFRLLGQAIEGGISGLVKLVSEIPGKIVSALGDVGKLLFDIGKKIIGGLVDGIKDAIGGALKSTVGSVAGKIASWKGPLSYDRTLLVPAGEAIMQGLVVGLRAEENRLKAQLGQTTGIISGWDAVATTTALDIGRSIGQELGQGIAEGLMGSQSLIAKSMTDALAQPTPAAPAVFPPDDDSFESNSFYDPDRLKPGAEQAEDGSWYAPGQVVTDWQTKQSRVIGQMHGGGVVPGLAGEESWMLLKAGERVTPADEAASPDIDYDRLAAAVARALRDAPPVVRVDDISRGMHHVRVSRS